MDWTSIIIAIIGVGGFTGIFLIVEKKSAATLENAQKLIDMYKDLAEERRQGEERARAQAADSQQELMTQIKMNSSLRHNLDDAHTECAVAKLMYCKKAKCVDRDPPFGNNANIVVEEIKESTKKGYQNLESNGRRDNTAPAD